MSTYLRQEEKNFKQGLFYKIPIKCLMENYSSARYIFFENSLPYSEVLYLVRKKLQNFLQNRKKIEIPLYLVLRGFKTTLYLVLNGSQNIGNMGENPWS